MSQKEIVNALKDTTKKADVFVVEGIEVRTKPVSAMLIQEVTSNIKDPIPPLVPNPDKDGKLEENPFDPVYVAGLREANVKRSKATSDTLIMFGLELVDGLPKDDNWLVKLRKLEKMGLLDLSGIDFEDQFDREFAFKKFIAGTTPLIMEVTRASGVSQADVDAAVDTFPGDEA
jgi:hypothetical protein